MLSSVHLLASLDGNTSVFDNTMALCNTLSTCISNTIGLCTVFAYLLRTTYANMLCTVDKYPLYTVFVVYHKGLVLRYQ